MNGMIMIPITTPAVSALVALTSSPTSAPTSGQERAHRHQSEEAVDDGRDAGEDFDDRLHHGADARAGILVEIDRRHQPKRQATSMAIADHQRAPQQRQQAVLAVAAFSVPTRKPGSTPCRRRSRPGTDEGEEADRLGDQRGDDAERRQDGDARAGEQQEPTKVSTSLRARRRGAMRLRA
jgi:hypothetical protein